METRELPPPVTISEDAAAFLKEKIDTSGKDVVGIRVDLTNKGCAGQSYKLDLVLQGEESDKDLKAEGHGITLFIPSENLLFIVGSELVKAEDDMGGFRLDFRNPNETDRCGCGESIRFNPQGNTPN